MGNDTINKFIREGNAGKPSEEGADNAPSEQVEEQPPRPARSNGGNGVGQPAAPKRRTLSVIMNEALRLRRI